MKNTPEAQIGQAGWPCPEGHGNMRQAQASDRLHILDAVMEVKKEGN